MDGQIPCRSRGRGGGGGVGVVAVAATALAEGPRRRRGLSLLQLPPDGCVYWAMRDETRMVKAALRELAEELGMKEAGTGFTVPPTSDTRRSPAPPENGPYGFPSPLHHHTAHGPTPSPPQVSQRPSQLALIRGSSWSSDESAMVKVPSVGRLSRSKSKSRQGQPAPLHMGHNS